MDQLMARLTVVQQQLMSVWVPGQQRQKSSKESSVRPRSQSVESNRHA